MTISPLQLNGHADIWPGGLVLVALTSIALAQSPKGAHSGFGPLFGAGDPLP